MSYIYSKFYSEFLLGCFMYRLEAKNRNLRNIEPEASVASGKFLIAKISLLSL